MARDGIHTNDRQLACARINSKEGQDYLVRHGRCPCFFVRSSARAHAAAAEAVATGGHGMRRELRVGEPKLDDVPLQTGAARRAGGRVTCAFPSA